MRRVGISLILIAIILLVGCGKRSTAISVTDPRTGAVNTLEHESDTRQCGKQKACER